MVDGAVTLAERIQTLRRSIAAAAGNADAVRSLEVRLAELERVAAEGDAEVFRPARLSAQSGDAGE